MANNALNVAVGKPNPNGGIYRAPLGTALPADEAVVLNAAFKSSGYVSSEGVTRAISRAFSEHNAWGGDMVKKVQGNKGVTVEFSLIESRNADVLKSVYGDSAVTVTAGSPTAGTKVAIAFDGAELPVEEYVFELKEGLGRTRIVCPRAQNTTEDVSVTYSDEAIIEYAVSLTLYPDASGKYFYEYTDDGVVIPV